MNENELYWEISDFTGNNFSLWDEGAKIYSQKLTIKDVEKHLGKKIKVCPAWQNPDYIVEAKIKADGTVYIDNRKKIRGTTYRCYIAAKID